MWSLHQVVLSSDYCPVLQIAVSAVSAPLIYKVLEGVVGVPLKCEAEKEYKKTLCLNREAFTYFSPIQKSLDVAGCVHSTHS